MKKIIGAFIILGFLAVGQPAAAQDTTNIAKKAWKGTKKGTKKAWKGTKKVAGKVGDETAETATKGKAKLTDKKSDEWVGPNGQDVYVDDGSKYYWINEKGGREFLTKEQLKAKQ